MSRFLVAKNNDTEYLAAVEAGDINKCQALVEQTAKAAGYTIKAYHGTQSNFTQFNESKIGQGTGNFGHYGKGFYFTDDKLEAITYTGNKRESGIMECYLKIRKPFSTEKSEDLEKYAKDFGYQKENVAIDKNWLLKELQKKDKTAYTLAELILQNGYEKGWEILIQQNDDNVPVSSLDLNEVSDWVSWTDNKSNTEIPQYILDKINKVFGENPLTIKGYTTGNEPRLLHMTDYGRNSSTITNMIKADGFDGIIAGSEIIVFSPSQIKSADSITYDDSGAVIPLSKRFDSSKLDIRSSIMVVSKLLKAKAVSKELWQMSYDEFAKAIQGKIKPIGNGEIAVELPNGKRLRFDEKKGQDPVEKARQLIIKMATDEGKIVAMAVQATVKKEGSEYFVYSEKGKKLSKGYKTKEDADKRLSEIEYFKHAKGAKDTDWVKLVTMIGNKITENQELMRQSQGKDKRKYDNLMAQYKNVDRMIQEVYDQHMIPTDQMDEFAEKVITMIDKPQEIFTFVIEQIAIWKRVGKEGKVSAESQIEKGVKVEKEHSKTYHWLKQVRDETGEWPTAEEFYKHIAENHTDEFKNYYDALDIMEAELKAEKKDNKVTAEGTGNLSKIPNVYTDGDFMRWKDEPTRIELELNPPMIAANPTNKYEAGIRYMGWAKDSKKFNTKEEAMAWLDKYDLSRFYADSEARREPTLTAAKQAGIQAKARIQVMKVKAVSDSTKDIMNILIENYGWKKSNENSLQKNVGGNPKGGELNPEGDRIIKMIFGNHGSMRIDLGFETIGGFPEVMSDADVVAEMFNKEAMNAVMWHDKKKTAMKTKAWKEDQSDITPLAGDVMDAYLDLGFKSRPDDSEKPRIKKALMKFKGKLSDADKDVLEDYNYHMALEVINELDGKTDAMKATAATEGYVIGDVYEHPRFGKVKLLKINDKTYSIPMADLEILEGDLKGEKIYRALNELRLNNKVEAASESLDYTVHDAVKDDEGDWHGEMMFNNKAHDFVYVVGTAKENGNGKPHINIDYAEKITNLDKNKAIKAVDEFIAKNKVEAKKVEAKKVDARKIEVMDDFKKEIEGVTYEIEYQGYINTSEERYPDEEMEITKPDDMPQEIWDNHYLDIEDAAKEDAWEKHLAEKAAKKSGKVKASIAPEFKQLGMLDETPHFTSTATSRRRTAVIEFNIGDTVRVLDIDGEDEEGTIVEKKNKAKEGLFDDIMANGNTEYVVETKAGERLNIYSEKKMEKITALKNLDKIKNSIGTEVYNHISGLSESQLRKMKKDLESELARMKDPKAEYKPDNKRDGSLQDELWYLNYRLGDKVKAAMAKRFGIDEMTPEELVKDVLESLKGRDETRRTCVDYSKGKSQEMKNIRTAITKLEKKHFVKCEEGLSSGVNDYTFKKMTDDEIEDFRYNNDLDDDDAEKITALRQTYTPSDGEYIISSISKGMKFKVRLAPAPKVLAECDSYAEAQDWIRKNASDENKSKKTGVWYQNNDGIFSLIGDFEWGAKVYTASKKVSAMTKEKAIEVLKKHSRSTLSKLYDTNEEVAEAVKALIPNFEYPDYSHMTIGEIIKKAGAKVKAASNKVWIVTEPTKESELVDILFQADGDRLELQFKGGLTGKEIVLITEDAAIAKAKAEELLKKAGAKVNAVSELESVPELDLDELNNLNFDEQPEEAEVEADGEPVTGDYIILEEGGKTVVTKYQGGLVGRAKSDEEAETLIRNDAGATYRPTVWYLSTMGAYVKYEDFNWGELNDDDAYELAATAEDLYHDGKDALVDYANDLGFYTFDPEQTHDFWLKQAESNADKVRQLIGEAE